MSTSSVTSWRKLFWSGDGVTPGIGAARSYTSPEMIRARRNVDLLHEEAVRRGLEIVYPLTDEPWGIRRFFVRDPDGVVINVAMHL